MAMPYRPPTRRQRVRTVDGEADRDDGQRGRLHRHAEAGDHVGGMAGLRGLGHLAHRRVFRRGVVLGDHDHRGRQREADQRAAEHGAEAGRGRSPS